MSNKYDGVFVWINASNGDTLMAISLMERVLEKYPNLLFFFGCWKAHAYLAEHLPINIMTFLAPKPGTNYYFNKYCPPNLVQFNAQIGLIPSEYKNYWLWKNEVFTWNSWMSRYGLSIEYDELEINLPYVETVVKENAIFLENGVSYSDQNDFSCDVEFISNHFPHLTFYCNSDPKTSNNNVVDLSKYNLIYLQNVLKKCKAFIGKGSGPFFLTCNKELRDLPKALFGYKLVEKGYLWDEDYPVEYYDGDDNLIVDYLNKLNIT
jgi:hypothetical protein